MFFDLMRKFLAIEAFSLIFAYFEKLEGFFQESLYEAIRDL